MSPALNLEEFAAKTRRWCENAPAEAVKKAMRLIALEALRRIVLRTPVDTGRARGNWQISIGGLKRAVLESESRGAGNVIDRESAKFKGIEPFDVVYVENSLPYIEVLEFGGFEPSDPGPSNDPRPSRRGRVLVQGGFSVQAPQGMISVTFEELQQIFPGVLTR